MNRPNRVRVLLASVLALMALLVVALATLAGRGTVDVRDPGDGQALEAILQTAGPQADDAPTPEPQSNDDALAATNCRYGVGYVPPYNVLNWIPTLDAGWYITFGAWEPSRNVVSAEFAPVVRVRQDINNGTRLPTYSFNPPLAYYYQDENGFRREGLGTLIAKNPGHYWIVGNEPDVDNSVQDNTMPDVYARAYHEAYNFIKQADPTAKVAIAGLSMMTPGRLQYLDIVWNTYKKLYGTDMPVDIWNMHLYILEERNPTNPNQYGDGKIALGTDPALGKLTSYGAALYCPDPNQPDTAANDPRPDVYCRAEHDSVRIFKEQVYNMRNWMKAHGQQNKPLIISEFGLLYPYIDGKPDGSCEFLQDENQRCFNPQRVTDFLNGSIQFLENTKDANLGYPADENRLVQQWLWYSIVTEPEWSGGSSNLIVRNFEDYAPGAPAALTQMGKAFEQLATSRVGSANLVAGEAYNVATFAQKPANTASVMLTASFRNSGTRSVIQPVKVTFYSNQALTKEIGSVTYEPTQLGAVTGCTWGNRNSEHVKLMWNNLPVGTHNYWVKIDSNGTIPEQNENDNVTLKGTVTVYANGTFVPVVQSDK